MLVTLPFSADFSDGSVHGWYGNPATPTTAANAGQAFTQSLQTINRDTLSVAIPTPGGLQIKVAGWLNAAGLGGHPTDGSAWTLRLGLTWWNSAGVQNYLTSNNLVIAAGNGWTAVSDTFTTDATCVAAAGWVQIDTTAPNTSFYGQAALLTYTPMPGGYNLIALPCDAFPDVTYPSSIEFDPHETVAVSTSPFTGQSQTYDWMASWFEGQVSFPPMRRHASDAWSSFILQCRGQSNAFQLGDPKAVVPKGAALGTPVVSGAGQTGYSLVTRGWKPNVISTLRTGDYIQVGYRLYKVLNPVNSDANGNATLSIWPNLRDQPADGTTIQTRNCKGLYRLSKNSGNKFSTNPGAYGFTGFGVKEAI